jgi:hypothetical protein
LSLDGIGRGTGEKVDHFGSHRYLRVKIIQYLFRFQISKIRCAFHWVFLIEIESNLAILTCQIMYPSNTNIYLVIVVPMTKQLVVLWLCPGGWGEDYGMVAISFGPFDTLFKFQLINSKHKIIKI